MSIQHRLLAILEEFMAKISNHEIEVYNEFSLQHELGIFLRKCLETEDEEYKTQFERNIGYFFNLDLLNGSKRDQIYSYFRNEELKVKIETDTNKPTGENKNKSEYKILLNKKYTGNWKECQENLKYLLIEVDYLS